MSNEESTNPSESLNDQHFITDPELTKWYHEGFRFAVNYLHAIMPENGEMLLNQENFKDFVNSKFSKVKIEDDFFQNHLILERGILDNENYPDGWCPGPGTSCVQCPDPIIEPL